MKNKRFTVALDLDDLDQKILEFTSFLCRSLPVEKIYFVHVTETLDLPESFLKEHPEAKPLDETIEAEMANTVAQYFTGGDAIELDFEVIEGKVMKAMLHQTKVKMTDLLIVGKRDSDEEDATMAQKLARHSLCSVFFVPETFTLDIKNILIPVDYSAHSALAVNRASRISDIIEGDTLHVLNIYDVPKKYYKLGKTYEEVAKDMKAYSEEDYAKFKDKVDFGDNIIHPQFVDSKNQDKATVIREQLKVLDCQMLVIGSKGRTNLAAIFMGSLTEKLIKADLKMPMLVVKQNHENLGFIEALLD